MDNKINEEVFSEKTRASLEYSLDIIRRTLSLLRAGPLDLGMTDLSISRLESVEDKLMELLNKPINESSD